MLKKFYLDEPIDICRDISSYSFQEVTLYIAKSNASWVVLDNLESTIFEMIRCKKKLNEIIDYAEVVYRDKYAAIEKVKNLLKKLYKSHFLENFAQTEDFVPTIHFYITNECNLKCKHCYMDAGKSLEDELSEEEIKLFFGKLNKVIGPTTVVLSGGEPLLKRNFMAISEYIRDLGNRTVLITNGTLIDKKNARKIANLFDIIQISLDGATEKVNDAIRGKGSYKKVIDALNCLTDTGAQIYLSFTVMPTNEKDLTENLIPFLETIKGNVKPLVGSMLQEGRAKFCENYSITELRSIIKNLYSKFLKNGWDIIRTPTKGIKRDGCLYRTIVINSNGDIYPCPIIKKAFLFSNIRNETDIVGFFQRWKESFEKSKVENMSQCSNCDLEYICGGGCRLKNYEVNKSIMLSACTETDRINFYLSLIENEIA